MLEGEAIAPCSLPAADIWALHSLRPCIQSVTTQVAPLRAEAPACSSACTLAPVRAYIRVLIPGLQMFDIETGADTELLNLNPEVGHGL